MLQGLLRALYNSFSNTTYITTAVTYINNLQLIETTLNIANTEGAYKVCPVLNSNAVEAMLANKEYAHFICELPFDTPLRDKISA